MAIFAISFVSISISCQTHSFKQYFQNIEPENPRTKIKKCYQNEQLKFINTIYNQLNIYRVIFSWLNWLPLRGPATKKRTFFAASLKLRICIVG